MVQTTDGPWLVWGDDGEGGLLGGPMPGDFEFGWWFG